MKRLLDWLRAQARAYSEWFDALPPEVQAEVVRQQNRHM
jgi:hypothetical protein